MILVLKNNQSSSTIQVIKIWKEHYSHPDNKKNWRKGVPGPSVNVCVEASSYHQALDTSRVLRFHRQRAQFHKFPSASDWLAIYQNSSSLIHLLGWLPELKTHLFTHYITDLLKMILNDMNQQPDEEGEVPNEGHPGRQKEASTQDPGSYHGPRKDLRM